jgi:ELWxxDGT repeat protein
MAGAATDRAQVQGRMPASAAASIQGCQARTYSSSPSSLTASDGRLFFTADDGIHGDALWKSDGTRAGTVLVKDLAPSHSYYAAMHGLTDVRGTLFFGADETTDAPRLNPELWKSDGTRAGTVLVKDISRRDGSFGRVYNLTPAGGRLFFVGDDGPHGPELWTSDGTREGTVLVKDIDPEGTHYDSLYTRPSSLTAAGGQLFFTVDDGTHGRELWVSDGTRKGTVLVEDIHPESAAFYDYTPELAQVGKRVFFVADDGVHGEELWTSDGTEQGTTLVKDISAGSSSTSLGGLTNVAGTLFFPVTDPVQGHQLWTSDGTEEGTVMVEAISEESYPSHLTDVAGTLYFIVNDPAAGSELWTSDGTQQGTVMVKDLGGDGGYYDRPSDLTDVGGRLFFTFDDGVHGRELWTSDGTEEGTVLVKDILAEGSRSVPSDLTAVGDVLMFTADNGARGQEPWISDGTHAGTVQLKDVNGTGRFEVPSTGQHDTSRGTLRVEVRVAGGGRLVVRPAGSRFEKVVRDLDSAGTTAITLRPTREGRRLLRQTGRLPVQARFTFTPCGGTGTTKVREYTLRLE